MSQPETHGVVRHEPTSTRRTDYLYRISLKCLVRNDAGEVLVVKEAGRDWWDLPGGGMDHGESIKSAIAREMHEEVHLQGDFGYHIIDIEEPAILSTQNFWQMRLIFEVTPDNMTFSAGDDGDEVTFMDPGRFKSSGSKTERLVYNYSTIYHSK